jgi:uncharacterized protein YecE (DUF72 family)
VFKLSQGERTIGEQKLITEKKIKKEIKDSRLVVNKCFGKNAKIKVRQALDNPDITHNSLIWLIGYLRYIKYSEEDVIFIFNHLNKWEKLKKEDYIYQVNNVFENLAAQDEFKKQIAEKEELKRLANLPKPFTIDNYNDRGISVSTRGNKAEKISKVHGQAKIC